jgi:hypothetical protein
MALVKARNNPSVVFDDVIAGKGTIVGAITRDTPKQLHP